MTVDREQLRALAEQATPGPWREQGYDETDPGWWILGGRQGTDEYAVCVTLPYSPRGAEDAAFIAACSPDVLAGLLDALTAAEHERDVARRAFNTALDTISAECAALRAAEAALAAAREALQQVTLAAGVYLRSPSGHQAEDQLLTALGIARAVLAAGDGVPQREASGGAARGARAEESGTSGASA